MAVHFYESETVTPLNRNTRAEGVTVATTKHSSVERRSESGSDIVSNGDPLGNEDRAYAQELREHEALPQQERTYVLDTSVLLSWIKDTYNNAEMIAFCANIGQEEELKGLAAGAVNLAIGLSAEPFRAGAGTVALAALVGCASYGASIGSISEGSG